MIKRRRDTPLPNRQQIKQDTDAKVLLDALSRTHGLDKSKYRVTKGKDGGDRVVCGQRNLNVTDFMTKRCACLGKRPKSI
ncbi:hypothetical protein JCM19233_4805 [Vibrio astriarenae]|nr:hypothetical protein JCM19233_4805 [Vibrio sp. C7]